MTKDSTGLIDDEFPAFSRVEDQLTPAQRAACYEEWADFYEWRLEQRAEELATDNIERHWWRSGPTTWPTRADGSPPSHG